MKRRFTAAAVSVVALGLAGCSSGTDALTSHDARVSINGKATNALQPVTLLPDRAQLDDRNQRQGAGIHGHDRNG